MKKRLVTAVAGVMAMSMVITGCNGINSADIAQVIADNGVT